MIRFFTSAALRPHEEIDGEVVQWLPRSITVEFDGDQPVTGVWRSDAGDRRVCWYAAAPGPALVAAHAERYGDEPFWIVDRSALAARRIVVSECDDAGRVVTQRAWELDRHDLPAREEERAPDGALRRVGTYQCTSDGTLYAGTEQRAGGAAIAMLRPIAPPVLALAGEPFPCGGTITRDGPRLVASIMQNQYQARLLAVYRHGTAWKRGLATIATSKSGWEASVRPMLDFGDDRVAALVRVGELHHRRRDGYPFLGVVEALPDGRTLDERVLEHPLAVEQALGVALEVAAVARRAHAAGHQLGGIRPELVYVQEAHGRLRLTGIAHRGPAVIAATYSGEQIRWPPVFAADFANPDDTRGLAQLVWYALTGGHPFLAADDLRWNPAWNEFRHRRRHRQPWTGPAMLGPVLERVLFDAGGGTPDFDTFVGELERLCAVATS